MEPKKPNEHSSVVNGDGFRSKRGGDSQRTSTEPFDHWAFLEEIDAPMWVDLTSTSIDQDINASWFEVAHPFHQLSSQHLLGEGKVTSDAELLGPSSPRLPSSVSKSRGKHYRSRRWRGDNYTLSMAKKHPIKSFGAKTSLVVSSSCQEVKPKCKISSGNPKRTSSWKERVFNEKSAIEATRPNLLQRKPQLQNRKITPNLKSSSVGEGTSSDTWNPKKGGVKFCFGDSKNTSSVTASFSGNSNSTSTSGHGPVKHKVSFVDSGTSHTITPNAPQSNSSFGDSERSSIMAASFVASSNSASLNMSDSSKPKPSFGGLKGSSKSQASSGSESNPQDSHTVSDLSHQIFGQTSGLLLAVRASLRRSYVTRQPARVEVKDKRQSNGRKSSSSKSSVGSSTNPGCNLKNTMRTSVMKKSRTPESKQVKEVDQPTNHNKAEVKVDQLTSLNKAEVKDATKTQDGQLQVHNFNPKRQGKATTGRPVQTETSKLQILYLSDRRKPLRLQNRQSSFNDGPKARESVPNANKGSVIGYKVLCQKTASKENNAGSTFWTKKALKHSSLGKENEVLEPKVLLGVGVLSFTSSNELLSEGGQEHPCELTSNGKTNARNSLKNPKNVVQRVYFR